MINNINLLQTTDTQTKFEIFRIEAGTVKGVNIPCILALPQDLKEKSKLTLVFNNEDGQTLNESTRNIEEQLPEIIDGLKLNSPVIIPILPSQKEFNQSLEENGINFRVGDPKQFARECFSNEIPIGDKFYRLDNQVQSLIQNVIENKDLKSIIQSKRSDSNQILEFSNKLNGFGHSGAGAAMLRFALLHPELLDTLIIGGNGDIIPTPFGENADKLDYPFGSNDYKELFGRDFLEDDYKKINFQFYIGDLEDTKPVYDTIRDENYSEGKTGNNFAPEELATTYKTIYGTPFFERFKNVLNQYERNEYDIGLKIYKNDCHSVIKAEDLNGILNGEKFFDSNCSEQLKEMLEGRTKSTQSLGREVISEIKDVELEDKTEHSQEEQEKNLEDKTPTEQNL